ncbi:MULTISPECIES: hypothetical protein [Niastella]|uniref:Uncharacterized protein n=1 Tax=Niastella soli TaxID=2821487 RepID=A0ABS3Z7L6_9BACT|nr:hypothetical protein [Niastella soli]MBO9205451.1 hypothetical protein [Niastella soli]
MKLDFDYIDAYKFTIGKTYLYGNLDSFLSEMGLPNMVTLKKDFNIHSKADLDQVLSTAKTPEIATLHYPGIDMWYGYENDIIPSTIDFRKTDKSVTYGTTIFNKAYTIDQFKKQFPISANHKSALSQSFFEIVTLENGKNMKHFYVVRKSKDDPNATPLIEFTFDKGNLIFLTFSNF